MKQKQDLGPFHETVNDEILGIMRGLARNDDAFGLMRLVKIGEVSAALKPCLRLIGNTEIPLGKIKPLLELTRKVTKQLSKYGLQEDATLAKVVARNLALRMKASPKATR